LPLEQRRRIYVDFEGVHYLQIVPRWNTEPLILLDKEASETFIKEIGLRRDGQSHTPFVFVVEKHHPKIAIVCGLIGLSDIRPESSDYHDL
jgi:hypothetical protein